MTTTSTSRTTGRTARWATAAALAALAASVTGVAAGSAPARADASCTSLPSRIKAIGQNSAYPVTFTMQRQDNAWTAWATGYLTNSRGSLVGTLAQSFSDRTYFSGEVGATQAFSAGAKDSQSLVLAGNGVLHVHNNTWGLDQSWNLTCHGSLLTHYDSTFGQLTITMGSAVPIPG